VSGDIHGDGVGHICSYLSAGSMSYIINAQSDRFNRPDTRDFTASVVTDPGSSGDGAAVLRLSSAQG
jgi:hypothetical protein